MRKEQLTIESLFTVVETQERIITFICSIEDDYLFEDEYNELLKDIYSHGGSCIEYVYNAYNFNKEETVIVTPTSRISCCKLIEKNDMARSDLRLYYPLKLSSFIGHKYYIVFYNFLKKRNKYDIISFCIDYTSKSN